MPAKSRWKFFFSQLPRELNGVSGLGSVGGTVLSVAGWATVTGPVGIALAGVGGLIAVGAFGHAVKQAIPAKALKPEDLVGKPLSLSVLDNIEPSVPTLGIVGPSRAGKTTLKERLAHKPSQDKRTQSVTAYILPLQDLRSAG